MADLIDRQTAIDTAIEAADKWDGGYSSEREGIIRKFFDKVPAVQPDHIADIGKKVSISCAHENDVIFRKVAIEALARMMPRSYTPDGSHPADEEIFRAQEVFADCIEALEILPSAQPEQRWIPCSERLPENDNEVLITVWDAEDDYVEVYKGFYQGHEWWTQWCHGCSKIKDEPCGENIVIAWMSLPEPYRGGEE